MHFWNMPCRHFKEKMAAHLQLKSLTGIWTQPSLHSYSLLDVKMWIRNLNFFPQSNYKKNSDKYIEYSAFFCVCVPTKYVEAKTPLFLRNFEVLKLGPSWNAQRMSHNINVTIIFRVCNKWSYIPSKLLRLWNLKGKVLPINRFEMHRFSFCLATDRHTAGYILLGAGPSSRQRRVTLEFTEIRSTSVISTSA